MAVTRRQRFLHICWNLLSGCIPVRPVCRARTKKRTAETLATDLSSSVSAARASWKMTPSQWDTVDTTLVIPSTDTMVSDPWTSTSLTQPTMLFISMSRGSKGCCCWANINSILESQKYLRTLGTLSLDHSLSMKVFSPKLLMQSLLVLYMTVKLWMTLCICWPRLMPTIIAGNILDTNADISTMEEGMDSRATRQGVIMLKTR